MTVLLGILLAGAVIALVAYAAYCQDAALREAREAMEDHYSGDCLTPADMIRMGFQCDSAATGRQCGGPSEQVGNGSHPVNGFGSDAGACEGVTSPGRGSGEAGGHV